MVKFIAPDSLPYFKQVYELRTILAEKYRIFKDKRIMIKSFPGQCCVEVAKVVQAVPSLNLEFFSGFYTPWIAHHCWNYDRTRGLYVDLTLCQFAENGEIPEIAVLPEGSGLLNISESSTHRFKERRTVEAAFLSHSFGRDDWARLRG